MHKICLSFYRFWFAQAGPRKSFNTVSNLFTIESTSSNSVNTWLLLILCELNHPAMNTLDLRHNLIEDDGAILIARALAKNTTLQTLYMGYNCIRGEAIKAFAEALSENSTLKKIDLAFLINDPSGMPGKGTLDEVKIFTFISDS